MPRRPGWYNLSTHFPWIGDRTRALDGAHVEYFRGIANPIGVKVGPAVTPDEALALADVLNPQNEPGRLTFIHRFGADRVEKCLPPLAEAIRRRGQQVLWCCDPMHGNTETTKERHQDPPLRQDPGASWSTSCRILKACGAHLGGVHFELTGDNVTECIGGASGVTEADLSRDYRTHAGPAAQLRARRWRWRCCWRGSWPRTGISGNSGLPSGGGLGLKATECARWQAISWVRAGRRR